MENPLTKYLEELRTNRRAALTDDELEWITERYPFFVLPYATTAAAETDPERRARLMERVALAANDPLMLFRLIDPDGSKMANFYPPQRPATPDTDSAIDTFLNTYSRRDPREDALLERLIFNPVADYTAVLEKEAEEAGTTATAAPPGSQDAQLDAFLATRRPIVPTPPPADEKASTRAPLTAPPTDSSLSESLAKIYIRQQRYDKAYEIIYQLSLNFPKKSIYFADQLRFLQKLIRNQQLLNDSK